MHSHASRYRSTSADEIVWRNTRETTPEKSCCSQLQRKKHQAARKNTAAGSKNSAASRLRRVVDVAPPGAMQKRQTETTGPILNERDSISTRLERLLAGNGADRFDKWRWIVAPRHLDAFFFCQVFNGAIPLIQFVAPGNQSNLKTTRVRILQLLP